MGKSAKKKAPAGDAGGHSVGGTKSTPGKTVATAASPGSSPTKKKAAAPPRNAPAKMKAGATSTPDNGADDSLDKLNTFLSWLALKSFQCCGLLVSLLAAYLIRLHAVHTYGKVIHEFDPWFNYRATEYLLENGATKFFSWYDDKSWYPLGRPIGTTIYPGLQFTAVALYHLSHKLAELDLLGVTAPWFQGTTLNDVCVFVPAIFGGVTCVRRGLA